MKLSNTLKLISVLSPACLTMLLTGCAPQQKPQVEYRTISQPQISLPAELTSRINAPEPPDGMTFGDSVQLSAQLYGLVGQCNIDRAAIRQIEESRQRAADGLEKMSPPK